MATRVAFHHVIGFRPTSLHSSKLPHPFFLSLHTAVGRRVSVSVSLKLWSSLRLGYWTKPLVIVHHGLEKEKPFTCIHNISTTTIIMSVAVLFLFFFFDWMEIKPYWKKNIENGENRYHERKIPPNPASQEKDQGKQSCKIKPDCLPLFFPSFALYLYLSTFYISTLNPLPEACRYKRTTL